MLVKFFFNILTSVLNSNFCACLVNGKSSYINVFVVQSHFNSCIAEWKNNFERVVDFFSLFFFDWLIKILNYVFIQTSAQLSNELIFN